MKARVKPQRSEVALFYRFPKAQEKTALQAMDKIGIPVRQVGDTQITETIGELAWSENFQSGESTAEGEPVIIFGGLSDKRLDEALLALQKIGGENIIKGTVTTHNQNWTLEYQVQEMTAEKHFFQKIEKISQKVQLLRKKIDNSLDMVWINAAEQAIKAADQLMSQAKKPSDDEVDRVLLALEAVSGEKNFPTMQ